MFHTNIINACLHNPRLNLVHHFNRDQTMAWTQHQIKTTYVFVSLSQSQSLDSMRAS